MIELIFSSMKTRSVSWADITISMLVVDVDVDVDVAEAEDEVVVVEVAEEVEVAKATPVAVFQEDHASTVAVWSIGETSVQHCPRRILLVMVQAMLPVAVVALAVLAPI